MAFLRYITHPDVLVEPAVPVRFWGLSPVGVDRMRAMLSQPWVPAIRRVVSSDEVKARRAAALLAGHLRLDVEVRPGTGEHDRSSTGFVPPDEFEQLADRFFAAPGEAVRGWERAVDAQDRIAGELGDLLLPSTEGDVAVLGHGGVGTLWWCWLTGHAIDRRHDQPGQGHYFTVDLATGRPLHPWRPIDRLE